MKYLSHDESLRLQAIQEDKARMDHVSSLNRAEKKGKLEVAKNKNLLALGLDVSTISQGTGLSIEEVL